MGRLRVVLYAYIEAVHGHGATVETRIQNCSMVIKRKHFNIFFSFSAEIPNSIRCEASTRYAQLQNNFLNVPYYFFIFIILFYTIYTDSSVDSNIVRGSGRKSSIIWNLKHLQMMTTAIRSSGGNEIAINITKCFQIHLHCDFYT